MSGRVIGRRDWTPALWTLTLDAPVAAFSAGQFFQLALPKPEGSHTARAYSAASAPGTALSFYLALVAGGALTPRLHALAPGDDVAVTREAHGHFGLARVPDAHVLWLVATGTGLAPYLSMLGTVEPWRRFDRIVVVHGARLAADLNYADELAALSAAHGGRLTRVPLATRDPGAPGVLHARVPAALADGTLEQAAGAALTPETSQVLLCGNPGMIEEMEAALGARGLSRNRPRRPGHVTAERYW